VTACELIDQIHKAGGKLRVMDGQLYSKRIPESLVGELKRRKPDIIRYLCEGNQKNEAREPAATECPRQEPKYYTLDTEPEAQTKKSNWEWRGARYRWQRVCHMGVCDALVESPMGSLCSRCYPFSNGKQGGHLIRFGQGCTADVHTTAEHMQWIDEDTKPATN
jgi:hypothetical protein